MRDWAEDKLVHAFIVRVVGPRVPEESSEVEIGSWARLPGGAPGQSLTVRTPGFPGGEMRIVPSTPVVVVRPIRQW